MTYGDFKDLTRKRASDKILHCKAFDLAKNLKCYGYQRYLPSMVYKFFDIKKHLVEQSKMKLCLIKI